VAAARRTSAASTQRAHLHARARASESPFVERSIACGGGRVLATLRCAYLSSALTRAQILPQRLVELGAVADLKSAGYLAGYVEATFALMQLLTAWLWGRIADAYGRKAILVVGLLGCLVSQLAVGLADSFTALVLSRSAAGALNGNVREAAARLLPTMCRAVLSRSALS